jgi:hypothetical protein
MDRVLRRVAMVAAIAPAIACGPESHEIEVDCDAPAVPLVIVGTDELAEPAGQVGDVWVFEVTELDDDLADLLAKGDGVSSDQHASQRVVAVDECGEEPRLVAEGVGRVEAPPRADLPWLADGSVDAPGLWWIHPVDAREPERLSSNAWSFAWFDGGVLVVDDDRLVRIDAHEGGEWTRSTLVEGVEDIARDLRGNAIAARTAVVTTEGELVRVDLQGGTELVRADVYGAWTFDESARALAALSFSGHVVLDVDAGVEIVLGDGSSSESMAGTGSAIWAELDETVPEQTQIVLMPEVRELRLPGRWDCQACRAGAPVRALRGPDGIHLLASDADTPQLVFTGIADVVVGDEAIYLVAYDLEAATPDVPLGAPYSLLQMELDGSGLAPLFDGTVASAARLTDGRWATIDDVRSGGLGALSIRNGERTLDVDSDVLALLETWNDAWSTFDHPRADFLFGTVADGHGHNVVWLADADRLLP